MSDGSNGQDAASADEFDRELRAITEGTASEPRFREPSAAERSKASAARARQARKEAARNARQAKRETRKQRPHGGSRGQLTGALILVVVLAAAGGLLWLRLGHSAGGSGVTPPASAGPAPSASSAPSATEPSPSGAMSPVNLFGGPPADPFTRTPADTWADGAAGIVTPAAKPAGGFTAVQVATAYTTTRKLLIAADLNRQTLLGGTPTAFADLLTRQQRTEFLAGLNKIGLRDDGTSLSTRTWVASFAPGTTRLIGSVIKVHGTMSAQAGSNKGYPVLIVKVNYRFVYPVEPPGRPADWKRVVGQVIGSVEFGNWAQASTPFQPWVLFGVAPAGGSCGEPDGYIHPVYPGGPPSKIQPSGAASDPYSMAAPSAAPGCHPVTGT
jgi:hypothetical protein